MKIAAKIAVPILLLLAIAFVLLAYCRLSYVDNVVRSDGAYGFKIGESKHESFSRARRVFVGEHVFIIYPMDSRGYGPHVKSRFGKEDYGIMVGRNEWEFFFDEGFSNFIRLVFVEDRLVEIYRHRQEFELP